MATLKFKESIEIVSDALDSELHSTNSQIYSKFTSKDISSVVPTTDNVDEECNTLRMWIIGCTLAIVVGAIDAYFQFRYPTILVGSLVVQLLSYPLGQLWELAIPNYNIPIPFSKKKLPLNPGKFTAKEAACVFMFANVAVTTKTGNDQLVQQKFFFGLQLGGQYQIFWILGLFLWSMGMAGLSRSILVENPAMVWPESFASAAMLQSFYHKPTDESANGWHISRYRFFTIALSCAFVWYWMPGLLFTGLSDIGAWISWIRPESAVLSQVFGVKTGLGLFPLTFDWSQVGNLVSPLIAPWWSIWNVNLSFIFWVWIIIPALYYTNTWGTAFYPIMSNNLYDKNAKQYNVTRVITDKLDLNVKAYLNYSDVKLPISFLIQYSLNFATISSLFVELILDHHRYLYSVIRRKPYDSGTYQDIHNDLMKKYSQVPLYWYFAVLLVGFALSITMVEVFPLQTPWYGVIVFMLIGFAVFIPVGILESVSTFTAGYSAVIQIISGYWFDGRPLALIQANAFAITAVQKGLHFTADMKLAHYFKVPPKVTFSVQLAGAFIGTLTSVGVVDWVLGNIKDICTPNAKDNMVCRYSNTQFHTNVVYGLIGPRKLFGSGDYSVILWFFLVGALFPIAMFIVKRQNWKISQKTFFKQFSAPLFFSGATSIPSVTGINYSTWALIGFIFNYWIHKRYTGWWRKYNFALSAALDCGTDLAAIIIYFCVTLPGANISWWGNNVATSGCDSKGCPLKVKVL